MAFNKRMDDLEALNILALDYGLYALKSKIDRRGFVAAPTRQSLADLDLEQDADVIEAYQRFEACLLDENRPGRVDHLTYQR